jgi:hypothetical protein
MRATQFSLLVLLSCVAYFAAARRAVAPTGPRDPKPTIGDALDLKGDDEYLGRDWQSVLVKSPMSANRRIMHRDGNITGVPRRRGLTVWMKKREKYPWEKPWADPSRAPFKLRFLRHDPAGIALSLAQEGKLQLRQGVHNGRPTFGVDLPKPKPW